MDWIDVNIQLFNKTNFKMKSDLTTFERNLLMSINRQSKPRP